LPHPVGSAFRVSLHPLNGFLLLNLWNHFSGPSVHGVCPFRVFLPLKSRASLEAYCSHALLRIGYGRASRCCSDFRALLPSKSRARGLAITPNPESLLSWGFPALGFFSSPTLASREALPLPHFHSPPRRRARCPRVLLPEERLSSEERAYPSAVPSLFSLSNLFDKRFVEGVSFLPDARSRITAETNATSLTTKNVSSTGRQIGEPCRL
jgi:hypothetical protein